MIINIIYFLLAALALSFIVLIHELGHFVVARRNNIRIEVFSIGFGRPLLKWQHKGVEWRLCWILFGGYVKPAGQDQENGKDPHEIEGGYYHSSPWARIKVAAMGPIVNIVFAFIVFSIIWFFGGREQSFSKHTKIIGYVDPQSELYQKGVKNGDEIESIDGHKFRGFQDLLYSAITARKEVSIAGAKVDYISKKLTPFDISVASYTDPRMQDPSFKTLGIFQPARYMIYDHFDAATENLILPSSPMYGSGIQPGDRLVWINGHFLFSMEQMRDILNQNSVKVTVIKSDQTRHSFEIPKVQVQDLRLTRAQRQEMDDWAHALGSKSDQALQYFIPYALTSEGVVKQSIEYIDESSNRLNPRGLEKGDRFVAVNYQPVNSGMEVFDTLQRTQAYIIVERNFDTVSKLWKHEDERFVNSMDGETLTKMITALERGAPIKEVKNLVLLNPVTPTPQTQFAYSPEEKAQFDAQMAQFAQQVNQIKDVKKRAMAQAQLQSIKTDKKLGIALQDQSVIYNPNPFAMMGDVLSDTYRTLSSLVTGNLNPKWLSGPVGFVQAMHHGWSVGIKEALYWMGLISFGLAIFNLLPIPALDGGHICFSLYEWIFKKRVSVKVMEKMVLPFALLLIGLMIFVTFQDVSRLISGIFR